MHLTWSVPPGGGAPDIAIGMDFASPRLNLITLLRDAAEVEHALLVQYLYAAFSIKESYVSIRGVGWNTRSDLMGIAVSEMKHLFEVNKLLALLGTGPNFGRSDFPFKTDIYPFEFHLEPFGLASLARYIAAEAPADPELPDPYDAAAWSDALRLLGPRNHVNRLGSLYGQLLEVAGTLEDAALRGQCVTVLRRIQAEGEDWHFKSLLQILKRYRRELQSLPVDPRHPVLPVPSNPSALRGHPRALAQPELLRIAGLGNRHYWLLLGLLQLVFFELGSHDAPADDAARARSLGYMALAQEHMHGGLWPLGCWLAAKGGALPMDLLDLFSGARNPAEARDLVCELARESDALAKQLAQYTGDFKLPDTYNAALFAAVPARLAAIGKLTGAARPPSGAPARTVPAERRAQAAAFWKTYDAKFTQLAAQGELVEAARAAVGSLIPLYRQAAAGPAGPGDALGDRLAALVAARTVSFPTGPRPLASLVQLLASAQAALFLGEAALGAGARDLPPAAALAQAKETWADFFALLGTGELVSDGRGRHVIGAGNPPINAFFVWHVFNRAADRLDKSCPAGLWLEIGKCVGMAFALHLQVEPDEDDGPGSDMPLDALRAAAIAEWAGKSSWAEVESAIGRLVPELSAKQPQGGAP